MPWALILDGLLVVLLLLMIGYAFVLNRRLSTLRTDRADLEVFISRFNDATDKANASLKGLRGAAKSNAALIKDAVDKAQALRDELAFLVERADGSAARLAKASTRPDTWAPAEQQAPRTDHGDERAKAARPASRQSGRGRPVSDTATDGAADDAASEAERELLDALRRAR